eukprot:scaffold19495_cov102-Isochrysis_galbana.AAC.2
MTDPPIDDTQAREPDAPGTHNAKQRAPVHGHTGAVPPDKALSDTRGQLSTRTCVPFAVATAIISSAPRLRFQLVHP